MPERMLFVGRFVCHLDTNKADDRRCRIGKVIERIRHDRQRMHPNTDQQLAANSNTLQQIPTILDKIPYLVRTSALSVFSYSFTKHLTRKSVMGSPSFHNTFRNISLDKKGLTHRREALMFFLSFSIVGSVEKKVKPNIFSEILSTERKSNADCFFSAILRRFFLCFFRFYLFSGRFDNRMRVFLFLPEIALPPTGTQRAVTE